MTWKIKKLKYSFSNSTFADRRCRKISLKEFIRFKTTFKYWRMNLSWERYCASMIKSINTRVNFNACDHLHKNKNMMTNNNCRTMIFCFTSIHCYISKNRLNFFKFVNFETCWKRASSWSISKNCFNDVFFFMIFSFFVHEHFLSQQFLNSTKQMHDHAFEKLMQQIYRHCFVNVDQTMISHEIISIMNFHVIDLKNKILFLSFDLNLRSLMCSQKSSMN